MNSILDDLFDGNLNPSLDQLDLSSSWEIFFAALQAEAPELEPKFRNLRASINQTFLTNGEIMFYQGFSLAIKLFTAALSY